MKSSLGGRSGQLPWFALESTLQEEETSGWPQVNITGNYISGAGLAREGVFLCQLEYTVTASLSQ